jgi:hypothetical protein
MNMQNQRTFLDQIAAELNIANAKDWKKVTTKQVQSKGGSGLLDIYDGSLVKGSYQLMRFLCRDPRCN